MASIPSAATSVFQGMAAPLWASLQALPRPLPKFKLVAAAAPVKVTAEMSAVVRSEIIPRLALAHPTAERLIPLQANGQSAFSPDALASVVLERDGDEARLFMAEASRRKAHPESLYDDLLAPAASRLADLWREDRLSYTEVTIGLSRLLRLVRDLPYDTAYNGENDDLSRSALFAPRPGEQQTFGFYMLEQRFRWGGWRTRIETSSTREDLVANVRRNWLEMVCLSVSRPDRLTELCEVASAIRRASRNRDLVITVEGAVFVDRPDRVSTVGADAIVSGSEFGPHRVGEDRRRLATA